jgi:hypothetical protein
VLVPSPVVNLLRDGRVTTLRMPVVEPRCVTLRMPIAVQPAPPASTHHEPAPLAMDSLAMDPLDEEWSPAPLPRARGRARLAVFGIATLTAAALLIGAGTRLSHARVAEPVTLAQPKPSRAAEISPVPASAPQSSPPEPSVAPAPAPTVAPPVQRETAEGEKRKARAALEGGAPGRAIAAGERSVALDPTDAEAWLILGGAYQLRGLGSDAHRAFASCVRHGRSGPVAECRSLLQ